MGIPENPTIQNEKDKGSPVLENQNGFCPRYKRGREKAESIIANIVEQIKESCAENVGSWPVLLIIMATC